MKEPNQFEDIVSALIQSLKSSANHEGQHCLSVEEGDISIGSAGKFAGENPINSPITHAGNARALSTAIRHHHDTP